MKRYILVSVMIMIGSIMIAVSLQDTSNEEQASEQVSTTLPIFQREDAPIFEETDETLAIPDPCVAVSADKVTTFVSPSKVRGPLLQNAIAPTKSCEWFPAQDSLSEPRLTISIAANEKYFDALVDSSEETLQIGNEAHVVDGLSSAIGAAPCGKTLVVKLDNYSFAVGLCKADSQDPTNEELSDLASDILVALSA